METRAKDLQSVLDWMALQELTAEYGQAIDVGHETGDWSRWINVFTPQVTADYTRFRPGEQPFTVAREQLVEFAKQSLRGFTRVQHATAMSVRIQFKGPSQAEVMAYAEVAHYFPLGGVQQEWTIVARYTHQVEKTAGGWRIRAVLLDPIHYRGNLVGLDLVQGRRLV